MTNKLYAKPILENRFWILESDGKKVGTICKQEDRRYMFSCCLLYTSDAADDW